MKRIWIFVALIILIPLILYIGKNGIQVFRTPSSKPVQTQTETSVPPNVVPSPTPNKQLTTDVMIRTDVKGAAYITDDKGMTLYIFDKDNTGVSNCNDSCAITWPPLSASSEVVNSKILNVTIIKRLDGSLQYAYKGMPLYLYIKDKQAGDISGNGVDGVWHLVKL